MSLLILARRPMTASSLVIMIERLRSRKRNIFGIVGFLLSSVLQDVLGLVYDIEMQISGSLYCTLILRLSKLTSK